MNIKSLALGLIFTLIGQMAYAQSTFICSRDDRPADGNFFEVIVQEANGGTYDLIYSSAQGGFSPTPNPEPIINQLLASELSCVFPLDENVLVQCTHAERTNALLIERSKQPFLEHLFAVHLNGVLTGFLETSDCELQR